MYGDLALDTDESFSEASPYRPRTPYNASKAGADHAVRAYHETYELPVTVTNCCNNYGPYQFPEKVIPLFATKAVDGNPLPLYASTLNRREWLHVDDHCSAIDVVLERGEVGETYHVGSGREASIEELADQILATLGQPSSLKTIVPDRPGHDRRYLLDSSKIRTRLGWEPRVSFEQGLAETVSWYAANRGWWAPLRDRAPEALAAARAQHREATLFAAWMQWQLDEQWRAARAEAARQGVELMGDLPFVVSTDSADVWSRRDIFRPELRVGTPPDAFSAEGQDWGLPSLGNTPTGAASRSCLAVSEVSSEPSPELPEKL